MPKPYRRKPTKVDEMPSLWDQPTADDIEKAEVQRLVDEQRLHQSTPRRPLKEVPTVSRAASGWKRPTELEFISFGNGSSGNCSYIGIRGVGGVIVDAGIDATKVLQALKDNYIPLERVNGILLTHDHNDHVRYVYQLAQKLKGVSIYCTMRTITGILRRHSISKRIKDYHKAIYKEFEFDAGPFKVIPFEVSHDGTDNVGFSIAYGDSHFVVATDMGKITDRADYYMRMAHWLMIESNYDSHMLDTGRYAEYLKSRIRSDIGHLDNAVTAAYLQEIWSEHLRAIYLCHLSNDNNTPEIAIATTRAALQQRGIKVGDASGSAEALQAQVQLTSLPRYEISPLYVHRIMPNNE